jgi:hypothetical protein
MTDGFVRRNNRLATAQESRQVQPARVMALAGRQPPSLEKDINIGIFTWIEEKRIDHRLQNPSARFVGSSDLSV